MTARLGLHFRVDPVFAEAITWRALLRREAAGDPVPRERHHERAAVIYDTSEPDARERAFAELAMRELAELGLLGPIEAAFAERPVLSGATETALVGEADGRAGEGVTADPKRRLIGLRVRADRFGDLAALGAWARHTLGHVEDTVEPAFGFDPAWEDSLGAVAAARLHLLWDVSVDGRSARSGRPLAGVSLAGYRAALAAILPWSLTPTAGAVADRLWDGPRPVFDDLRRWATLPETLSDDRASQSAQTSAPVAGRSGRCPLCAFPCPVLEVAGSETALRVREDFPAWEPESGICPRCLDRYQLTAQVIGRGAA